MRLLVPGQASPQAKIIWSLFPTENQKLSKGPRLRTFQTPQIRVHPWDIQLRAQRSVYCGRTSAGTEREVFRVCWLHIKIIGEDSTSETDWAQCHNKLENIRKYMSNIFRRVAVLHSVICCRRGRPDPWHRPSHPGLAYHPSQNKEKPMGRHLPNRRQHRPQHNQHPKRPASAPLRPLPDVIREHPKSLWNLQESRTFYQLYRRTREVCGQFWVGCRLYWRMCAEWGLSVPEGDYGEEYYWARGGCQCETVWGVLQAL